MTDTYAECPVSADLCGWSQSDGSYFTSGTCRVGNDGGTSFELSFLLSPVPVPQGMSISIGALFIKAQGTSGTAGTCNLIFHGEAADNAVACTSGTDGKSRPRTTASVLWNNVGAGTDGTSMIDAPGLETIIQEIVTRVGWVNGNNINIFLSDNGSSVGAYRDVEWIYI